MLLKNYVENIIESPAVRFEYGYLDRDGSFLPDELLSLEGTVEEVARFVQSSDLLRNLYACGGECNDFEVRTEDTIPCVRFIDFR